MKFEKVFEEISGRPGNTEKTSENIPKEAGSLQELQDFQQLIHMEIKDTKESEEESEVNIESFL